MRDSEKNALRRLVGGGKRSTAATTDDLQNLLLQVVFALLMVFMIAYFIFVEAAKKKQQEEIMELNHQKLVVALGKVGEDYRMRYGLNALMTQGTDGKRTFDADEHVKNGQFNLTPAAKAAFSSGSGAAFADYKDTMQLSTNWHAAVLATAELTLEEIGEQNAKWLETEIKRNVENVRLDARGVQRALAARLQKDFIEHPEKLGGVTDARALAAAIKEKSLEMMKEMLGTEVLP